MLTVIFAAFVFVVTSLIDQILFTAFVLMAWLAARKIVRRVRAWLVPKWRAVRFWFAARKAAWQASARRRLIMMLFGPTLVVG